MDVDDVDAVYRDAQLRRTPRMSAASNRNRDSSASWASERTLLPSRSQRNSHIYPASTDNGASAADLDFITSQYDVQPLRSPPPIVAAHSNRNSGADWESALRIDSQLREYPRASSAANKNRHSTASYDSGIPQLDAADTRPTQSRRASARYNKNRESTASCDSGNAQRDEAYAQLTQSRRTSIRYNKNRDSTASYDSGVTLRYPTEVQPSKVPRTSVRNNKNRESAASYDSGITLRDTAGLLPTKIPRTSARYSKNRDSGASWDSIQREKAADQGIDVSWEGPEDPTNPYNWKNKRKYWIVANISILTLIT